MAILKKIKRIAAIFALVLIAFLIMMLLYISFTGGKKEYILALLFSLMVVPVVLYVIKWFIDLTRKK